MRHRPAVSRLAAVAFLVAALASSPGSAFSHAAATNRGLASGGEPGSTRTLTLPQELVSFPTADGGIVYADVYGAGDRGVVLAHGGRFTKESWAKQAPVLAAAGFRVVAIDFRGRGQSHGGTQEGAENDVRYDVLAAVRYLRSTGAHSVSVVGASFGGGAAAQAAVEAEPGEIDRIVLLAHSPIDEPELMQGAKLFIVARDDPYFGGELRLVDIRDQYERAQGPKELVVLDGDAHAQFIFDTDQGERLMHEILRFLSEQ